MFKKLLNKKLLKNQKGLTLIELLAVVVILAIVAAIAIPAIGNIIENSRYTAVKADAINVLNAANLYYTDTSNPKDPVTAQELIDAGFLKAAGKLPPTLTTVSKQPLQINSSVKDVLKYEIKFSNISIDKINEDTVKGSDIKKDHTVGTKI